MSSKARKRSIETHKEKAAKTGTAYLGRNSLCPCGSGKKIKKCCLRKINAIAALPPQVRDSLIVNRILHGANAAPLPGATGPGTIPPAVAARFAAIKAAQAAAQAANPDDGAAQVVASLAAAYAGEPTDAHPQATGITGITGVNGGNGDPVAADVVPRISVEGGYVEFAGQQFEIESAEITP